MIPLRGTHVGGKASFMMVPFEAGLVAMDEPFCSFYRLTVNPWLTSTWYFGHLLIVA